jgi:serine protease Do
MKSSKQILAIVLATGVLLACTLSTIPVSQSSVPPALQDTPNAPAAAAPATPEFTVPKISASTAGSLDSTLESIYDRVSPSVVNVQSLLSASAAANIAGGPNANPAPTGPTAVSGSGFVWDSAGHIITNNHVVNGAIRIVVFFPDGTEANAKVIGADKNSDLAVLQVNVTPDLLKPLTMGNSDTLKVGEMVVAIGYPFGLDITMTRGIISGLSRTISIGSATTNKSNYSIPDLIQTDAPINPGNSGGVLVNENGEVIGVTNAIESPIDASVGIGFAIPSAIITRVVPHLITDGTYVTSYIGVQGGTLTSDLAQAMSLDPGTRGILIETLDKNGPAAKAGLLGSTQQVTVFGEKVMVGGDVITAINNQPVKQFEDLISYLFRHVEPGQKVTLTILREGNPLNIDVTLSARPAG